MAIDVACVCGKSFKLKDDLAGKKLKCPACEAVIVVPAPTAQADPAYDRDKFLIRQKRIAISEKYYIWDENNHPILFVVRPAVLGRMILMIFGGMLIMGIVGAGTAIAMQAIVGEEGDQDLIASVSGFAALIAIMAFFLVLIPKRHITFYRDDTKAERMLFVQQDYKIAPIVQSFTVIDDEGNVIAKFYKNVFTNILRKRWWCKTPDGVPICLAKEESIILSLLRRLLGPMFGLLRSNYIILEGDGSTEKLLGEFNRKITLFDRYVLDLTKDKARTLDRRLAVALGVLLDTGERR